MIESKKLQEKGLEAVKYYSKMENRFVGKSILRANIPRDVRKKLIETLVLDLAKNIELIKTCNGYSIKPNMKGVNLLTLTTHDFAASVLRGKGRGLALFAKDCVYINRWTPLVLYSLCEVHGIEYEDFWIKGNPLARLMLGKDLKDLTVPVKLEVLDKLSPNTVNFINGEGARVKKKTNHSNKTKGYVDYEDRDSRIIRFKSPLYSVVYDEYPSTYKPGLSKTLMKEIVEYYIKRDITDEIRDTHGI